MNILRNLFGKKNKADSDKAVEIFDKVLLMVTMLMVEEEFDVSAPRITDYLRDKTTPDIVYAIRGSESTLKQGGGLINPAVITNARKALIEEVKRRRESHLLLE